MKRQFRPGLRQKRTHTATATVRRLGLRIGPPLIAVVATGLVGIILLTTSHAATSPSSLEAESGTMTTNASLISDSTASGSSAVRFGSSTTGNNLFANGLFPIGVFVQPSYNFSVWKSRGVNTLVGVPDGNDPAAWANAADQAGFYQIREPHSNRAADVGDKWLLAYAQPDEPDGIYSQVTYANIQAAYANYKSINSSLPVYINFIGGLNQYDLNTGEGGDSWYAKYVLGGDWLSGDIYPVNNGQSLSVVGQMVTHLRILGASAGKQAFAFIETADISDDSYPGPNADQYRAEVWDAIIHGARGIWYFPCTFVPSFGFDATPTTVATEMTKQDATITHYASVLQGPINPSGVSASVASPLETAWRYDGTGTYVFVLNLSNATKSSQTITLSGIGSATSAMVYSESRNVSIVSNKITDDFAPYAVHIYEIK